MGVTLPNRLLAVVPASLLVSDGFLTGLCNGVSSRVPSPSTNCGVEENEEVLCVVKNLSPTPLVVSSVCPWDLPVMTVRAVVKTQLCRGRALFAYPLTLVHPQGGPKLLPLRDVSCPSYG